MKPLHLLLIVAAALVPAGWAGAAQDGEARVIVRFKPQADSVRAKALSVRAGKLEARDVAQTRATALGMRTGRTLTAGLSLDERTQVVKATGLSSAQLAARLATDPEVELVAVDQRRKHFRVPNDPFYATAAPSGPAAGQWYLKPASSTPGEVVSSINAPAAWDVSTGSASVVVAVLDTGVRLDHPDLAGQFVGGYDMVGFGSPGTTATAIANDGDGADADPSDPGDWVTSADVAGGRLGSGCDSSDIANSSWHGTRVSGLVAAASNNGLGMAGVAWGVKILPVRVLGKCGGYDSDIMAGMRWAAGIAVPGLPANPNRAKVLNLSLGGTGSCASGNTAALYRSTITDVNAAGSVIVVAAGNSAGQAVGLPGNCPGVISVAALRHVGTKVGFSSLGPEVTIAAPGGNCINVGFGQPCVYPMFSTTNSGSTTPVTADNAYTNNAASVGTSFSAPIVSGVVALMASVHPALTASQATTLLRSTARAFPATGGGNSDDPTPAACRAPSAAEQLECYCTTATCGAGMMDAAAAVAAAQALNGSSISITQTPASGLQAGQSVSLTAAIAGLPAGRSVASVAWVVTDAGGTGASLSGSTTATATLATTAAGSASLRVDMTDNLGLVYSQTTTVAVAAVPAPPAAGGGGGGVVNATWLVALAFAALSLRRKPRLGLRRA